jgi:hypothetical protein
MSIVRYLDQSFKLTIGLTIKQTVLINQSCEHVERECFETSSNHPRSHARMFYIYYVV